MMWRNRLNFIARRLKTAGETSSILHSPANCSPGYSRMKRVYEVGLFGMCARGFLPVHHRL